MMPRRPCLLYQFRRTALIWACINGHPEVAQVLLAAGAETEAERAVGGEARDGRRLLGWIGCGSIITSVG